MFGVRTLTGLGEFDPAHLFIALRLNGSRAMIRRIVGDEI